MRKGHVSADGEGPGLERTITLTDAVVAIAMTLLILPLVDVVTELDVDDIGSLWLANRQLLQSFVISFVVIFAFWTAHGTLYRRLRQAGIEDVRWLALINLGWLLMIAFLPFPTALIGRNLTTTTAPIYIATMLVLAALTFAMTAVIHRAVGRPIGLAWLTTAVFAVATVVSLFSAQLGLSLLLLLIVTGRLEAVNDRAAARRSGAG